MKIEASQKNLNRLPGESHWQFKKRVEKIIQAQQEDRPAHWVSPVHTYAVGKNKAKRETRAAKKLERLNTLKQTKKLKKKKLCNPQKDVIDVKNTDH